MTNHLIDTMCSEAIDSLPSNKHTLVCQLIIIVTLFPNNSLTAFKTAEPWSIGINLAFPFSHMIKF
ncbi:hypothetical protein BpHYR1_001368 [Brachionus plicatilis]|uniref:Uncharacterized protein n=1 Tax=Brachionus plicatilis TaxID=10195 RepID=A0A3M7SJT7_BRAPC|nr:hypothetical protein BpHYR1_001368 [Brachionus plicatilis]